MQCRQGCLGEHPSMSSVRKIAVVLLAGAAILTTPALAADKSSGRKAQEKGVQEIPVCTKRLGTIAVVEPDTNWWQQLGLGSPEAIIKVFVMKSGRSEEHTSELQSLMRISYAVFCLKKKNKKIP